MLDFLKSLAGPLLGAAGSLFGGEKDRDAAAEQAAANTAMQREFATHGIRWRVEDAKAAGLHPLYALQGGGATFTPNPIITNFGEQYSRMGQDLGRAATAVLGSSEREALELNKQEVASRIRRNDAESAFFASRTARELQDQPMTFDPVSGAIVGQAPRAFALKSPGDIGGVPLPPESHSNFLSNSPVKPGWDTYALGPGVPMLLPAGSSMSEALESVSESLVLGGLIVSMNARHFGPGWIEKVADHMGLPASRLQAAAEKADRLLKAGDTSLMRWITGSNVGR